jgi:phosphoglycerol transferase MdoB-like AlkP superfamily enzyme
MSFLKKDSVPVCTVIYLWPILLFLFFLADKLFFLISHKTFIDSMGYPYLKIINYVFVQDMGLLAILFVLSFFAQGKLRYFLLPAMWILLIVYFADSQLFQALYQRLTFINIYRFYDEFSAVASFISLKKWILFLPGALLIWIFRNVSFRLCRWKAVLIAVTLLIAVVTWVNLTGQSKGIFIDLAFGNVLRINQRIVLNRGFSSDDYLSLRKSFPELADRFDRMTSGKTYSGDHAYPKERLHPGHKQLPSIIMLISESLSQVDSLQSGGLFDRLPRIDAMQSDGLTLRNVISNGSNTSDALASLLLGIEPLTTSLLNDEMLDRFPLVQVSKTGEYVSGALKGTGRDLISYASSAGYKTLIVTNSPLEFQRYEEWLLNLGFDYIEGAESDFFSGHKQFAFNSPSDEVLYQRAINIISKQTVPFFMVLMTISLHPPYILPDEQDRTGLLEMDGIAS